MEKELRRQRLVLSVEILKVRQFLDEKRLPLKSLAKIDAESFLISIGCKT